MTLRDIIARHIAGRLDARALPLLGWAAVALVAAGLAMAIGAVARK